MHRNAVRVVEAARTAGLDIEVRPFPEGTRTAEDAARAIGVELGQIVKSLVFAVDGEPVVALVPGDRRLDETALAAAAGGQTCTRLDPNAVRDATGYPVGGIPPLGHAKPLRVFADEGLLRYDEVWAAAGTPHENFGAAPVALIQAARADVARLSA
jgi:Cys-tRNA(Pro) deacylase